MKKILAIMAMAAMTLVACTPNNNDPDDPENGNEKNYVAPITIDGNYDDWAKLDASKVQVLKCAQNTSKTDLKLAKVYADKYYVFVYAEFDFSAYDTVNDAHFHFYINGDNDTSTGGYKGAFDQGETPCVDVMTEGDVIEGGAVCDYDPGVYVWDGPANYIDWSDEYWGDPLEITDFVSGKGNKKAFEFRITRELYPAGKLAKTFTMGMDILVNGWDATGALPNAEASDTNPAGEAPLLTVTISK
ncbi:MAG: hypothetical protein IKX67_06295 [Bacteroidales bacterium]|nr:hypothetical protein [Bacteroidales bacterium]